VLASCGPPLYGLNGANSVPWLVTGGPPFASGTLRVGSFSPAFDAALGATLVSNPPAYTQSFTLGPSGTFNGNLWTPASSRELHYQVVVADPAQPLGFASSNAIEIAPLWTNMQALRDARYKLIRLDPCTEEFYDLAVDPLETTELLAPGLTAPQRAAYERLAALLDGLR
ncbi:MAG: hypothetical protein ABL998_17030, partial [Planctomycetota bacterium]